MFGIVWAMFLLQRAAVSPAKGFRLTWADSLVGIVGCKIFCANADQQGKHTIWSLGGYTFVRGMPVNIAGGNYDQPEWSGVKE
jgi:hypothetical protein